MRRVWEDAPKTLDVILQDCSEVDLTCLNYHWPSPFMCGFASMVLWGGAGHSIKSCQPIHTDTLTSTLPRLVLAGQHRWHDNQGFSVGCFDDGCFMLFHVVSCCFTILFGMGLHFFQSIQLTRGSRCSWPSDGAAVPEVQRCHVASENGGFHCFYHQNDPRYSLDAGEWGLTTGIWGKYPISRQTHKIY